MTLSSLNSARSRERTDSDFGRPVTRYRSTGPAVWKLLVLGLALAYSASGQSADLYNNFNTALVNDGPKAPTVFQLSSPAKINELVTYHWHEARGAAPGSISLRSSNHIYGPFSTHGESGQGGVPNAAWIASVDLSLPAGRYSVLDSDPATWSQNAESGYRGFAIVRGTYGSALASSPSSQPASPPRTLPALRKAFALGDVFVAEGRGNVQWRSAEGTLIQILKTGRTESETTGLAFGPDLKLYVTGFRSDAIDRFDMLGNPAGTFGEGFHTPESIVFDRAGNAYVGNLDGGISKRDAAGKVTATFAVGRVDWIDLAPDQCTVYFTDEGTSIHRFNVCTNTAPADFATGLAAACALRILANGQVMVADESAKHIVRLNAQGKVVQTYSIPGESDWFALNLDPDGKSFWSASLNHVYKFDLATGKQLLKIDAGDGTDVGGLAILGEHCSSCDNLLVTEEKEGTRVILEDAILFDFNRSELKPEARRALARLKTLLIEQRAGANLLIEGYTDDIGTPTYNKTLSTKRAEAVAEWMVRNGIEPLRIKTHGYGKEKPRYANNNDENRAKNRRVEIVVQKP